MHPPSGKQARTTVTMPSLGEGPPAHTRGGAYAIL